MYGVTPLDRRRVIIVSGKGKGKVAEVRFSVMMRGRPCLLVCYDDIWCSKGEGTTRPLTESEELLA